MSNYVIPFLKGLPTIAFTKTAERIAPKSFAYDVGQKCGELSALALFTYSVSQIPDNPSLFIATGATLLLTNLISDHYEGTQKQ
jgi:hypothetical protein